MATNVANVKHRLYDVETQPVNKPDAQRSAIKAFNDSPEFFDAIKKMQEIFLEKGRIFKLDGLTLKCVRVEVSKPSAFSIKPDCDDLGEVHMKVSLNKKAGASVRASNSKTGSWTHTQLAWKFFDYVLQALMDNHSVESIMSHIVQTPQDIPTYTCSKCAEKFQTPAGLAVHSSSCHGKKRQTSEQLHVADFNVFHSCDQCNENFIESSELDKHKAERHHSKRGVGNLCVNCKKCSSEFTTYEDLRQHFKMMHEASPMKRLKSNVENQEPIKPKSVQFQIPDIDNQSLHQSLLKNAIDDNLIRVTNEGRVTIPQNQDHQAFTFKNVDGDKTNYCTNEQMAAVSAVISEQGKIKVPESNNVSPQISPTDQLAQILPNHKIYNVRGDGACMPRAASVAVFNTQDYFELISKVVNKNIVETLPEYEDTWYAIFGEPRIVGGEQVQFTGKEDFANFMGTDKSVYLWREFHDYIALADLFGLPADCYVIERGNVNLTKTIQVPVQPNALGFRIKHKLKLDKFIFANIDNSHFVALVDPLVVEDANVMDGVLDELREYLATTKTVSAKQPDVSPSFPFNEIIQKFEQLTVSCNKNETELNRVTEEMRRVKEEMIAKDKVILSLEANLGAATNEIKFLKGEVATLRQERMEVSSFPPNPPVTNSQVSDMDVVESVEKQDMQVLFQYKNSGFNRVSPQASPQKKEILGCNVCKFEFKTRVDLENHLPEHKQKEKFPCNVCKIELDSRVLFEKHINTDMHMRNNTVNETILKSPLNVQHKVQKDVNSVTPTPAMHGAKMFDGKTILKSPLNVNHVVQKNASANIPILSQTRPTPAMHGDKMFDGKTILKSPSNVSHVVQKDASANIPTLSQTRPSMPKGFVKRQYNCHVCSFQGTSSKNLQRHVRETSHKLHDDLSEKCFTCDMVCSNFEELMIHRKISHRDTINPCRFNATCKFKEKCWYRHDDDSIFDHQVKSSPNHHSNFQEPRKLPPDQLENLCTMLKELITSVQQLKEDKPKRQRGL